MKAKLSEGLIDQIRKTVIVQDKHLLISDADEVLLNFLPCFENYLQNNSNLQNVNIVKEIKYLYFKKN